MGTTTNATNPMTSNTTGVAPPTGQPVTGGQTISGGAPTGAVPEGMVPPSSGLAPSPLPNQQVAPLTPQQLEAMQLTGQQTGGTQGFLNNVMNSQNYIAGGDLLGPSNPYLQQYFNTMAQPLVQNYEQAVAPNILQTAASSGTLGSQGVGQAFTNAQTGLAQGLGNLGAGLGSQGYGMGLSATNQAAANAPSLAAGQYIPAEQLNQSGAIGQNQAQNVLNTGYNNLYSQAMWPYQELNMLGQGLGMASGGGSQGTTISTTPYAGSGKG